jgi:tetratricopeptide (TPR) repeat protein
MKQATQRTMRVLLACLCISATGMAWAQQAGGENCGAITSSFGPFDYRVERGNNLNLVESAHFTPSVEALIKGNTGMLGGDLNYTLSVFPNHHRALMSVMRYGEKMKNPHPPDLRYSVECYFDRAIRFRPDDGIPRMMYAIFLAKGNRNSEATQQLDIASANAEGKENPFTHYNLGLNYMDLKEYDKAQEQAHKAYALGFLQPELKDKLKALGKWTDMAADHPEDNASAPAEPASAAAPKP